MMNATSSKKDAPAPQEIGLFVRGIIGKNELLLMKSHCEDKTVWNFPGGKVEKDASGKNETLENALMREIFEETDLRVKDWIYLGSCPFYIFKKNWIGYFFWITAYEGSYHNKEPLKCDEILFIKRANVDQLDNLHPVTQKGLKLLKNHELLL